MKNLIWLCLLVFLGSASVFAQHQVTGKVVDSTGETDSWC